MLAIWRNVRFQRIVFQTVFAVVAIGAVYVLITSMQSELDRIGLKLFPFVSFDGNFPFVHLSWDFLDQRAGFDIAEQKFGSNYTPNDSYRDAFIAGLLNTVYVSSLGIFLATFLGLAIGIMRLSKNWLLSKVALIYVETFRNIPLLVQLIFWYLAVYLKLPKISEPLDLEIAFVTNRAVALPFVNTTSGFGLWAIFLVFGAIAAAIVWVLRRRREENTGRPSVPWIWAAGTFAGIGLVSFLFTGLPLETDTPTVGRFGIDGGTQFTPELAALLTGLTVYTASFIAEIVRGSIQAIPKGQTEAAAAVGLNGFQRLRYVILPQTLRISIPPITNQYLNLMKNSSLAVAVGFKDLFDVGRVSINQVGQAVPIVALLMVTYLLLSLTISLIMNTINSRLKWGER